MTCTCDRVVWDADCPEHGWDALKARFEAQPANAQPVNVGHYSGYHDPDRALRRAEMIGLRTQGWTYHAIAGFYGLTRERVRQIVNATK